MNCTRCGKETGGGRMCQACLGYAKQLRQKKISEGRCQWCGKPVALGKTLCQSCIDKQNDKIRLKRVTGECTQCSRPAAPGHKTCLVCCQKRRVWKYGISLKQYALILAMQDSKCQLCGGELDEINIDHDHRCCTRKPACGQCIRGILCRKCNLLLVAWGDSMLRQPRGEEFLQESYPILFQYLNSRVQLAD